MTQQELDEFRKFWEGDQWTPEQLANPEKLERQCGAYQFMMRDPSLSFEGALGLVTQCKDWEDEQHN